MGAHVSPMVPGRPASRAIARTERATARLATPPNVTRSEREVLIYSDALAPLAKGLSSRTRRKRVSTLSELRSHFDAGAG